MVIQSRGQGEGNDIILNQERQEERGVFVPSIQPALIQTQRDDIEITGLWQKKKSDDLSGKLKDWKIIQSDM